MPTLIDSLVVELGLDAKKFLAGTKDSAAQVRSLEKQTDRSASEIAKHGDRAAEFFTGMKRAALALSAVMVGSGIQAFVANVSGMATALRNVSTGLDVNVQELSAWQNAVVRIAGGTAQDVTASFQAINTAINEVRFQGHSDLFTKLAAFGITPQDANGRFKKPDEIAQEIGDKIGQKDPSKARYLMGLAGITPGMQTFLLKPRAERDAELKRQREQTAMTEANVTALNDLNKATIGLEQKFMALATVLAARAAPTLIDFIDIISSFVDVLSGKKTLTQFMAERAGPQPLHLTDPLARRLAGVGPNGMRSEAAANSFSGSPRDEIPQNITPPTEANRRAVMEQARAHFLRQGYTPEQTAGILANIAAESNFDPTLLHDSGTGYGLFGHRLDRRDAMFRRAGTNTPSVQQQLDFASEELRTSYDGTDAAVRGARTAAEAASAFTTGFERPARTQFRARERANSANNFLPGTTLPLLDRLRTLGTPNPAALDAAGPPGALSQPGAAASGGNVTVGDVTVHTQATDAKGIASAMGDALRSKLQATRIAMVPQANMGLV